MNVEVKASKVMNRVAIETGFPCITTIYRCKKVKVERGGGGALFWRGTPRFDILA